MEIKEFNELTKEELYQILQLRSEVFVVEQNCVFQDIDDIDKISTHYFVKKDNKIVSYVRSYKEKEYSSFGRVCTLKNARNQGLSRQLIDEAIKRIDKPIKIYAQYYLQKFYESFGFKQVSDVFLEDGIEHIEMTIED